MVTRASVPVFALAQEDRDVPELGGVVRVQSMPLSLRVRLMQDGNGASQNMGGILASCVRGEDGAPLMDADGWEAFGAQHFEAALGLLDVAIRVSHLGGGEAKNG